MFACHSSPKHQLEISIGGNDTQQVALIDAKQLTINDYKDKTVSSLAPLAIERLKHKLDSLCLNYLDHDSILGIAVEYIDLKSNIGFDLFPQKRFIPASLLKIPILIAAFKLEEEKPGMLASHLSMYDVSDGYIDKNLPENEGYPYSGKERFNLRDLLKIMTSYSDNRATVSIMEFLNHKSPGIIERVEKDLNASLPPASNTKTDIVAIGHFTTMLKSLFSCTYLSESHSREALAMLCSGRYGHGIKRGIPSHIPVAHKFGVRFNVSDSNPEFPVQLHEVGLIYHPTHPFLLSVMTKGVHIDPLRSALAEIARECYQEINASGVEK